ncbi:N-acetylmuramic acid 6-phosphate etherase [Gracilibacillus alcaliphilus]|uniref:N-acetylmuramic acid 6-phosphate etherase n=1 Tax=Gracilibacillus alcaliphilus TaxID=1401441 RepID=UPI001956F21C|nr:N-acetylmuramic acid 6-phosphate etherase [Gracilibacillus alcaliphilus]MBM7676989.1 N-acetylmuramic acid 6-phosphate etherase [Gracilibacillus alcaliphilus]
MEILTTLTTEQRNKHTMEIDNMSTYEILKVMNQEDMEVAQSVAAVLPEVAEAVEAIYHSFIQGGRLFYVGAGTSGRIGILDAVECPPTFSTPPEMVQGMIAGGNAAIMKAVEGAEDDPLLGAADLEQRELTEIDVVVGIAASGRTPYVTGALQYAQSIGAETISLSSNKQSKISQYAAIKIDVVTGPEVLTGSTRLKAATAHKMILNMLTTTAMIKAGKVYENLMVDVKVSNYKLKERAKHIIATVTGASIEEAAKALEAADLGVKPAIVMIKTGVTYEKAQQLLKQANGFVRQAIDQVQSG